MVRLVVFDLDGTLVDSMSLYAEKAGELINKHYGLEKDKAIKLYLQTSGLPFLEQLNLLFPQEHQKNKRVAELFENWKMEVIKGLRIKEEGGEVLEELRKRGIITAISSNNLQEYVEKIVRNSGVEVDFVLGWDGKDFKKGKPHFSLLEKKTGIHRKHFLFVGDSLRDLILAKESGVGFVALEGAFKEEDFKSLEPQVKVLKSLKNIGNLIQNFPYPIKNPQPILPP